MKGQIKSRLFILIISIVSGLFAPPVLADVGSVYFHLSFPVSITLQTEKLSLNENYNDLIISNLIGGAMYARLLHEHFPNLKFDSQYIVGSLLAQLLQENLQTTDYQSASDWINPNKDIRNMLLMPGQGGPYQLNDYSKRLENKIGLINFLTLQKSLGYTIQDQDNGIQTNNKGPENLDNKYFGPLAAAYFQYNDLLRLQSINQDPWGPSSKYFSQCFLNLENIDNNILDMIMNAAYNAGPWSDIAKTYIELCANSDNPTYAEKIKHINDYNLTDAQYQQAIGTKESIGSTFILYPRQIRFYLDELYNNPTNLNLMNSFNISLGDMKNIFSKSMSTLAYVNNNGTYQFINKTDADNAFDAGKSIFQLQDNQLLDISNAKDRKIVFDLLDISIQKLAESLHVQFSEVTETNH